MGPFGWTWRSEVSKSSKPEFHEALRKSISEEGIRNPVLVWSFNEGIFLTFGGSRVGAAMSLGIDGIPAIINDYTEDFLECPEVTQDNYKDFFTDVPRSAEFTARGFDYHYNLERARRHDHDEAGLAWVDGTPKWINKELPWISSFIKDSQR